MAFNLGDVGMLLDLVNRLVRLAGLGVKRIKSVEEARALAAVLPEPTALPASGDEAADWAAAQKETTASERKARKKE